MLIDKRLFSDAKCNGRTYSNYNEDEKKIDSGRGVPFIRAFFDLPPSLCVLLCGEPSVGKSMACQLLNTQAMIERRHSYWFCCKHFSSADADYLEGLCKEDYGQTVIFDGYEELPDEDARQRFAETVLTLRKKGIQIVISARRDIREDMVIVYGDGTGNCERRLFNDFAMIELCPFTEEQLAAILPKGAKNRNLLKNAMLLSMYLEFCEEGEFLEGDGIVNEADLLLRYFKRLYEQKLFEEEECRSDLYDLGKQIHGQRRNRIVRNAGDCIPEPLLGLVSVCTCERNGKTVRAIESRQNKYLNFMHGYFLKEELLSALENGDDWDAVRNLFQISAGREVSEAYYYAGQLLENDTNASALEELLSGYEDEGEICKDNVARLLAGQSGENAPISERK